MDGIKLLSENFNGIQDNQEQHQNATSNVVLTINYIETKIMCNSISRDMINSGEREIDLVKIKPYKRRFTEMIFLSELLLFQVHYYNKTLQLLNLFHLYDSKPVRS